jgi:hypothetical protein
MGPRAIANQYYDAWINHHGDMGEVPLAKDYDIVSKIPTGRCRGPRPP